MRYFIQTKQYLDGVTEVDYYFARHALESLKQGLTAEEEAILFHLVMALNMFQREGHPCVDVRQLGGQLLWANEATGHIGYLFPDAGVLDGLLSTQPLDDAGSMLVYQHGRLYLRRMYTAEQFAAGWITARQSPLGLIDRDGCVTIAEALWPGETVDTDEQCAAVADALDRQLVIISGGPGTGKTTTTTKLLVAMLGVDPSPSTCKIRLLAPTGKAAQRLSESVGRSVEMLKEQGLASEAVLQLIPTEAETIHRGLGVVPNQPQFSHNAERPMHGDIFVIDEASMSGLELMVALMQAIPMTARVILLGDKAQLKSVSAGSVLSDLVEASKGGVCAVTTLTKSRRFQQGSIIHAAAESVSSESWSPRLADVFRHGGDRQFVEWIEDEVVPRYMEAVRAESALDALRAMEQFRLLTPTREGGRGTLAINQLIDQAVRQSLGVRTGVYRGMPIMITRNNASLKLWNGDVGVAWPDGRGSWVAHFEQSGETRTIRWGRLPEFELVFAMTVHKTQGSEFSDVALVLPEFDSRLLTSELLFTAVTRAKKGLTVWGSEKMWLKGISQHTVRHSGLTEALIARGEPVRNQLVEEAANSG